MTIPVFQRKTFTPREEREQKTDANRFFQEYNSRGVVDRSLYNSVYSNGTRAYISQKVDRCAFNILQDYICNFRATEEYSRGLTALNSSFKGVRGGLQANVGSFKDQNKIILNGLNPLEQFIILGDYLESRSSYLASGAHTLSFALGEDDHCPIRISIKKGQTLVDLFNVTVGHVNYTAKEALSYERLEGNEYLARQWSLHEHLYALEIMRQPSFATNISVKQLAWINRTISNQNRFKTTNDAGNPSTIACFEHKSQRDPTAAVALCKEQSSFTSLMLTAHYTPERPIARNINFSEFFNANYPSEDWNLSAIELFNQTQVVTSYNWNNLESTSALADSLGKLMLAQIGPSGSDALKQHIESKLR